MSPSPKAECRFCKCTAERPCRLPNGDECGFVTRLRNRCNAPACIRAFAAELKREEEADKLRRRLSREFRRQIKAARKRKWRRAA